MRDERLAIKVNESYLLTPQKNPLCVPTQVLADAMVEEWVAGKKFTPTTHPLTALAYTAIDRIEGQEELILDALMVYADTDTLSYVVPTNENEPLAKRQEQEWKPLIDWASREFGAIWQTASGIEPATQVPEMHDAIRAYLIEQGAMRLSAACVLVSCYSSLVLTLAVLKGRLSAEEACTLSCLEERLQNERWGTDSEAEKKTLRVKAETSAAGHFLRLLAST